ncbi:3-oxoacyl-[acyl-carrier-protein] synthase II, chloroplastic-like isoform X2 [Citrus sinensis]|uniref:3-oxoacyl-[acyl-carrier-protein] synthase II, chloroplastic-like isoform X2 n=1 Tax=Citrus sinensis TaxID=2711 RepID=UPI0022790085|nr:3-oxoacyl-[acyl-carrier-protein] synthase II, chloroplastic-like isoform X2 [Citrus sinensis]
METASLASPLCTSPAANYGNYHPLKSSMLKSPKRHKKLTSRCNIGSTFCIRNGFSRKTMAVSAAQSEKELVITKKKETGERRIVVTGLGAVTPLGDDAHLFHTSLLEGVTGISDIQGFDCSEFPTRIAAEIKSLSTDGWISPKIAKKADKYLIYALVAGKKALVDAGITEQVSGELDKSRCGVIIGSAMGGLRVLNDGFEAIKVSYKKMSPFYIPYSLTNMASAVLAMDLGWTGPSYSISTACASSNYSILNAASHMIKGDTDIMLCGGSDGMIIPSGIAGLIACNALSQRNSDPTKAARPWDADRDGFVMGEGAGVLLLEELEHAKKRGTNIYAEILGGSLTCDAYHITAPHPEGVGMVSCMKKALAQAGVAREDVNYINAHAPSTRLGDLREYQSVIRCFGKNPELRMNSTKSLIGHLLGASGAAEAVATIKAIQTGWIHPNLNLENPDKHVDAKGLVGPMKERLHIKVAMSNSFGFGGHNSSILFAPFKGN